MSFQPMPNRLADETSPYLLQHASNPVDWYPWGEEAWSRAAAEDRPVLLSVGYASCHWCHVMERETFADPEIAALLNRHFVCIKVDREERPDLDSLYVEALQTLTGSAGWPLTAFLTPERKLFFGGTYFPPSPRGDLPSFRSVIDSVAEEWRDGRRELERQAEGVLREMRNRDKMLPEGGALNADLLDQGILRIQSTADQVHGGFGEAPKFPQPWLVELMLRAAARGPGGAHGIADVTLRRMARGGFHDQIGGGFHRYTVDAAWRTPHFEKMLYDNALLARLYTHAWQARHDPLFARIAVETLEYLVRELRDPGGAFYAGEDSDSEGAEGRFYTWSYDDFMSVAPEAAGFYGITPEGTFEGRNVPTAAGDDPPEAARARLAAARASRTRPGRDEKILTSWNGLAIAALAEAGAAFGRQDFAQAAEQAAGFLMGHVVSGTGELLHSFQSGSGKGTGLAEDYAYLGDGLFTLWEATGDPRWIQACEQIARKMLALFGDEEGGGIFSAAVTAEQLVLRRKDFIDATTPSPNGVASLLLQRLGALLGSEDLSRAGVEILEAAQPVMQAIPQDSGTLFAALDFHLSGAREIAVVGDPGEPSMSALLREVWTRFVPNRVLAVASSRAFGQPEGDIPGGLTGARAFGQPEGDIPGGLTGARAFGEDEREVPGGLTGGARIASPLLEGRSGLKGRPAAYVCEHHTCKRPTSDPAELGRQLRVGGAPSPDQVNRAAGLARFTLHRIALFDRLDNPLWIEPLKERGFFATPPAPIDHYIPGATGSPPWPDSKYLARMAGMDPFAVHRVAMEIPETGNSLVHEDLADAALALPADLAADFAVAARGWLRSTQHHVTLPRKLGSLMSNLAEAGHGEPALDLARALFELLPDAAADPRAAASEDGFSQPPQPRARFGPWDYEQILKENFPDVVRAVQVPALDLLADLLVSALELSQVEPGAAVGTGSYLWRPAIGDDPRNLDRSVRNSLLSALRDAGELIARENPGMLPDLFDRLERRGWPVFRRIGLHLLTTFPEDAPGRVEGVLADRSLLDDPNYSREYLVLARKLFRPLGHGEVPGPGASLGALLPEARRSQILEWVQAGPDLARWDAVPARWSCDPDDGEEAGRYVRDWSSSRLAYLEAAPGPDESQDAAFAFPLHDPPVDLTTPKQADWLRTAPMPEIARFCRAWRAPGSVGAPAPAGLQKKLVEVVTSDPRRYAAGATDLVDLPAEYLRAVAIGLREAARQGTSYPWEPVLELFASVRERATAGDGALLVSIARCLAAGFAQGAGEIPHEHRRLAWDILRPITAEPEAEAEPESPGAGAPQRSVAAEGLQAAVRYALWVRRHLESQPHGRELARRGWDEMPEVREALEAHLEPGRERSPAVQAVYGQWFPWLLMLDPSWAAAHREEIFPWEADLGGLRRAAWDAYLAVSPVFDQVFELLSSDYEQAVEGVASGGVEGLTRPQQGLAEHLITLYLRGRIPLEGPDSLLARFFGRASELQRAHALAYVGQMVQAQQDRIPAEIILRLQKLWESRLDAARRVEGVEDRQEELAQFGAWFASGKLEAGWAVHQLLDLVTLTGKVGNTSKVVERLKTYMETMPYEVVQCIAALVARERGAITILGWGQDAQQVLSRTVGGSDPRARDVALELLDTFDLQPVTELIRWH